MWITVKVSTHATHSRKLTRALQRCYGSLGFEGLVRLAGWIKIAQICCRKNSRDKIHRFENFSMCYENDENLIVP